MSGDNKVVEKPEVIKKRPIIMIFVDKIVAVANAWPVIVDQETFNTQDELSKARI